MKFGRKFKRLIFSNLYFDSNNSSSNTIFLAGSGRSGTTWLSELINYKNDFRYMFEPFHNKKLAELQNYDYIPYLNPDSRDERMYYVANRILSGQTRNQWVNSRNTKFIAHNRLIKDIRANLILGWLKANFPEVTFIFMMRHPYEVVMSKLKLKWDEHIDLLLKQPKLIEDYLHPFLNVIYDAKSDFEKHVVFWAIENYIPLKQDINKKGTVLFYENLIERPLIELQKIESKIDSFNINTNLDLKFDRSSSMSNKKISNNNNYLNNWSKKVDKDLLRRCLQIIEKFELSEIYSDDIMPKVI